MGMPKRFAVFGVGKPLQGGHLSKADKIFCPVSVRFREVPLYLFIFSVDY